MAKKTQNASESEDSKEAAFRKGFQENYGYLMKWGGMYLGHALMPAVYVSVTGVHLLLIAYTAYLCMDDLGPMAESIHFLVLLSTAVTSVLNSLMHRNILDKIFACFGQGVFDYKGLIDADSMKEIEFCEEAVLKRKKFLPRIFIISVICAGLCISARPFIEYAIVGQLREARANGIRMFTIEIWYPFDTGNYSTKVAIFIIQYAVIGVTAGVVLGTDMPFLCMSEEFCLQLRIIGITLRNCDKRAKMLYRKCAKRSDYLGRIYSDDSSISSSHKREQFRKCLQYCVKQNIQHHLLIMDLFIDFQRLNRVMLLFLMVGATFLLCLSAILFVSDKVAFLSKFIFFLFLLNELVHTFIFCWYGEQIKSLSSAVGNEFYESGWYQHGNILKQYGLMMQKRSLLPLRLSAAGYMDVNLSTYANVLSSAYSYFNLLRAAKH